MIREITEMCLETNRLIIRPFAHEDIQVAWNLMQNEELFTYLHMDMMPLEEYQGLFQWLLDSYNTPFDRDFKYSFAITLKDTTEIVGWCGVGTLDLNPSEKEIYYLIGRDYWGEGYASEVVGALISYCFNVIKLPNVVAKVHPENTASKKILERHGFILQHVLTELTGEHSDCNGELYYALAKP